MADLMKKGLVCGLLIIAVALLAIGCAQQEAPSPPMETPEMEEPAADTTVTETTTITTDTTISTSTTTAVETTSE